MKTAQVKKAKSTVVEAYSAVVEAFIQQVGLDPKESRLEGNGKERAGWYIKRGSAPIYIYLEDSGETNTLRIESPILYLPPENILPFYRKCLELNNQLRDCALAVRDDFILLVSDRPLEGLTPEEVAQNIDLLSFAADNLDDELAKEFGAKLFSEAAP